MDYSKNTDEIEKELTRAVIALGIDIHDDNQVTMLVRNAFNKEHLKATEYLAKTGDRDALTILNLYGLIDLMFKTMADSAEHGFETHGGDTWKAIARKIYSTRP